MIIKYFLIIFLNVFNTFVFLLIIHLLGVRLKGQRVVRRIEEKASEKKF